MHNTHLHCAPLAHPCNSVRLALHISPYGDTKRNFNDTAKRCVSIYVGVSAHALANCTLHVRHAIGRSGTISFYLVQCASNITIPVARPMSSVYCHAKYIVHVSTYKNGLITRIDGTHPLPTVRHRKLISRIRLRTPVRVSSRNNVDVRRANSAKTDTALLHRLSMI